MQYAPQVVPTRRPLVFWAISAALVTFFVILIVTAPAAASSGYRGIAAGIYRAFGTICHQLPERSFFFAGH